MSREAKLQEYYKNTTPEQLTAELKKMGVKLDDVVIESLLGDVGEDKHQNLTTTSFKFKRDLWDFCREQFPNGFKELSCVEYGTHKGQTTHVLAYLFDKVYTFNLPNHFDAAKELNKYLENIEYIGLDLYNSDIYEKLIDDKISLFFIDAVHSYDAVLSDFTRSLNIGNELDTLCFFVFDDFGSYPEVHKAVEDLIWVGKLEMVKYIGHEPRHDFGQGRILSDHEGIICKLIQE